MIIDTLAHATQYLGLSPHLDRAIRCMMETDFSGMEAGRYAVDGDNVYYMVQALAYKEAADAKWEIHRNYIDIQLGLNDGEGIGYLPVAEIAHWDAYQDQKDVALSGEDQPGMLMALKKDTFMILFPQDAHRPCVRLGEVPGGRKVVFKVRVD